MPFQSYGFLFLFLPVSVSGWFLAGRVGGVRAAKLWGLAASIVFYTFAGAASLPILALSVAFNWSLTGLLVRPALAASARRRWVVFGVVANLLLLGVFKYAGFVATNLGWLMGASFAVPELALPLGLSFFTFAQIAYLVDVGAGRASRGDLLDYAFFVSFFAKIASGPITRSTELLPQLAGAAGTGLTRPDWRNLSLGLFVFAIGLFKKVMLADPLALWANAGFDASASLTFLEAWGASLAYTFQLYFDFSGYTDMAIGIGLLLNLRLPENFDSPYRARDLQEFWRRWHITLSRFLRDYVYVPLGGNRRSEAITHRNLVLTFLVGGLWHGAGWTFVAWGLLHGVGASIHRLWKSRGHALPGPLAWVVTFLFVNFAWVFFRAPDFSRAFDLLAGMAGFHGVVLHSKLERGFGWLSGLGITFGPLAQLPESSEATRFLIGCLVLVLATRNSRQLRDTFRFDLVHAVAIVAMVVIAVFSLGRVTEFLYVQF